MYLHVLEINFFFALIGLIVTAVYNFWLTENHSQLAALMSDEENGSLFLSMVSISAICGVGLTLSMLSLVMLGGPIMINIVGALKDVVLTYAGFVYMGNTTECTTLVIIGLAISFAGAGFSLRSKLKLVA